MSLRFYSHGKLLITGEYVVLDGAKSLAVPTKKGQSLEVSDRQGNYIQWQSFLDNKNVWIDTTFKLPLQETSSRQDAIEKRLYDILFQVSKQRPSLFEKGISLKSTLEFDRSWGLGSSSTLLANIAQWAEIDPYLLLQNTFGGSGYDIACAGAQGPITFQLENTIPRVKDVSFDPVFKEELFFVHLNKKQNSRESIQHYRATAQGDLKTAIQTISQITDAIIEVQDIQNFEELLETHERLISILLQTPTIKEQYFSSYARSIKSLGGWGGDFVLATGTKKDQAYFINKGYPTIISYDEMVL